MTQPRDICPVCGMKPKTEIPSVEHDRRYFHFCSDQCRETFIAHPRLYRSRSSQQQSETLKRRTMNLAEAPGSEVSELLISYLKEMMGVKKVTVEGEKIDVTYDLLQVTESQIEKELVEIGIKFGGGWLERLRRGWVRDSEEIELDNLAAPLAPSYNRTPPQI